MNRAQEIAWLAGHFEGEGCVSIDRPRASGRRPVYLQVGSTDLDVLERVQRISGCGNIREHRDTVRRGNRQGWLWQTARYHEVLRLLRMLRPFMCERRTAKFTEAISELEERPASAALIAGWEKRG